MALIINFSTWYKYNIFETFRFNCHASNNLISISISKNTINAKFLKSTFIVNYSKSNTTNYQQNKWNIQQNYVTLWLSNVSVKFWLWLRFFTCTDCGLWNHLQKIRGWKSATGSNKCNTRWVLLKVARTFNVLSLQTTILYRALTAARFKNKSDFFFK